MTIYEVIDEIRRLSIRLAATPAGTLRVDAPVDSVTPRLKAALLKHKDGLMAHCREDAALSGTCGRGLPPAHEVSNTSGRGRGPVRLPHIPSAKVSREPSAEAAWLGEFGWVSDLGPVDLPRTPFPLDANRTVVDETSFMRRLQADVVRGPQGPRARYGAVQQDCRILRGILSAWSNQN